MKKLALAGVLAVAGLLGSNAHAGGAAVCELGASSGTAVVLCTAAQSTLYNIMIDSGAAGDFAVCYDSASTSGWTAGLSQDGNSNAPRLASVSVTATNTTTALPASVPIHARNAANGIVCTKSAAGIRVTVTRQ